MRWCWRIGLSSASLRDMEGPRLTSSPFTELARNPLIVWSMWARVTGDTDAGSPDFACKCEWCLAGEGER